jgi:hypothetical protein
MFDNFYGFTGRPFQLTPDPAFYFESLTHRKALSIWAMVWRRAKVSSSSPARWARANRRWWRI